MIEPLLIGSLSFLAALSGAVVPGPVFAIVLSESLKGNKVAGPLIVLGHFIIESMIILVVIMGFHHLLELEGVRTMISLIGGSLLIIMGLKLIFDAAKFRVEDNPSQRNDARLNRTYSYNLAFSGFIASCSNPHFFLWWITMGLPLMLNSISIGILGFLFFIIGHAAADLSWFSFVGYSVYKGRRVLNKKVIQAILLSSAAFLIFCGIYVVFAGNN